MELADVLVSKSSGGDTVRVRPPLPAPKRATFGLLFFLLFPHSGKLQKKPEKAQAAS